jgi:iron complex transport system permease protein
MSKYVRVRGPFYSWLVQKRAITVSIVLIGATCAAYIISNGLGSLYIHPLDVLKALIGHGSDTNEVIVRTLRLPRTTISLLVGAMLAVSGAIMQAIVRNPLASPDIVGVTGGASLAAVVFIYFSAGVTSIHYLPFAAVGGAAVTAFSIYWLAWRGGVAPLRLVLIGIGISAAMSAIVSFLLVMSPPYLATQAMTWLTGSVYGASWQEVLALLPWAAIFIPVAWGLARHINAAELGDDVATGIGSRVQRQRFALLAVSIALAGGAVAAAGAIGFIALMAPHIARKLVGPAFGSVLPVAALLGGLLLLLADLIARTAFLPNDIPAGVFTAVIGAPFFMYLLIADRNR